MASETIAFGPIDQMGEVSLCAKIELTFPLISIFIVGLLIGSNRQVDNQDGLAYLA
jgi:hypothetical protein